MGTIVDTSKVKKFDKDMDATKRPLLIPPEFATYAENHGVFEMYQRLLGQLLTHKPEDPLTFLVEQLKRENDDVPRVVILGPPAAGKHSISKLVCSKLRAAHITADSLILEAETELRTEAQKFIKDDKEVPVDLWIRLVEARLSLFDCVKKGWVMDGFPRTREQALALQAKGISAKHCVLLNAPDTVLIERAEGKRVDPKTGDVYHTTFEMPDNADVAARLEEVAGCTEAEVVERLVTHHRHVAGILNCYKANAKTINADQPKADVFSQVMTFVQTQCRSSAPHTPRIILLGPTGAGKGVQAVLLANKYNIVNISCGQLIKQTIADETKIGQAVKPYVDKGMLVPDSLVLQILKTRLSQLDCVGRGWVLHGYPKTREQGEQLNFAGFLPNRVFFMDVPNDSILERLTLRMTDPITGERYHILYKPPTTHEIKQ